MPKAPSSPTLPLNGLFPIAKPSGPSSMRVIDSITPLLLESKLFDDPEKRAHAQKTNKGKRKKNLTHMGIKIGQGGTLDPLADGVLVIGVNRGTKHLNQFLECSKEYESIGLLGAVTTSMDSDDPVLSTAAWEHVTREDIEGVLDRFRGEIQQVPPIFSALKMDGKPLYEYARESKPLPRAIPSRKCQVSIDLIDFKPASVTPGDGGHEYRWPSARLSKEEKQVFRKLTEMVHEAQTHPPQASTSDAKQGGEGGEAKVIEPPVPDLDAEDYPEVSPKTGLRPPTFTVRMTVSSGTYVRSIVNDIGLALGCGAHVVKLTRTRQGEFALHGDEEVLRDGGAGAEAGSVVAAASTTEQNEENANTASGSGAEIIVGTEGTDTSTAAPIISEEEAMNAAPTSSSEPSQSRNRGLAPEPPSSKQAIGGSIPWPIFERAIAARQKRIESEQQEKEEAIHSGMSAEEIRTNYHPEEMKRRRWEGGLEEWEEEVLKRFKSVPVPISGGHGWRE